MAAVGELAVEAGEQRRISIEGNPTAGVDLQGIAPGARAVNREERTRYGHERTRNRSIGAEFAYPGRPHERRPGCAVRKGPTGVKLDAEEGRQRSHRLRL